LATAAAAAAAGWQTGYPNLGSLWIVRNPRKIRQIQPWILKIQGWIEANPMLDSFGLPEIQGQSNVGLPKSKANPRLDCLNPTLDWSNPTLDWSNPTLDFGNPTLDFVQSNALWEEQYFVFLANKSNELDYSSHRVLDCPKSNVGLPQSNVGLLKSNIGVDQSNVGLEQSGVGLDNSNIRLEQSNVGLDQSNIGLVQSNIGFW
jgi:hypothetical protein